MTGPKEGWFERIVQRLLLFIAFLYLVWRVVTAWGGRKKGESRGAEDFSRFSARSRDRRREAKQRSDDGVELIACPRCGTYYPTGRGALSADGRVYCSDACANALEEGSAGRADED